MRINWALLMVCKHSSTEIHSISILFLTVATYYITLTFAILNVLSVYFSSVKCVHEHILKNIFLLQKKNY